MSERIHPDTMQYIYYYTYTRCGEAARVMRRGCAAAYSMYMHGLCCGVCMSAMWHSAAVCYQSVFNNDVSIGASVYTTFF